MVQKADVKIWQPAIYARLSNEDLGKDTKKNSLSIEHQLEILKSYVQDKGWQAPKIFYDDDKTGTNFNRKGFQDMYAEAQRGNINVIIIKDTSRFGRNWVKSGDYFEKIEEMGVRFISIQEGIDTADPQCPALKMLPFYFIFNEWHSATTSEKIKTVLANNAKKGQYRTSFAPFGYQKDPADKHKLIIDPYSASVVKRIYELRLQKYSYGAIVQTLNSENIPSPSAYCIEVHGKSTNVASSHNKWNKDSLNVMFQNPAYRGDTANGKKTNASYKSDKRIRQPMSEWVIVENTHEPIVSREDWQTCYDMIKTLGRVRRTKESEMLPFTGILVCSDCGYHMRHNHSYYMLKSGEKRRHDSYNCRLFSTQGETACTSHYISVKDLIAEVIADIRQKAGELLEDENAMRERFYKLKSTERKTQTDIEQRTLKTVNKRLAELDKLRQATFEKSVLGGLSADMFVELARKYEAEKHELTEQAKQLTISIERQNQTKNDVETYIALMKKHADITELDRATVVELIDHITVSASAVKPREIVIHYNFIGNMESNIMCL
jgi:DNA invertase Pin-like site-specific DNA recombinase